MDGFRGAFFFAWAACVFDLSLVSYFDFLELAGFGVSEISKCHLGLSTNYIGISCPILPFLNRHCHCIIRLCGVSCLLDP